jgi:purine-binding chemotaxis protein CheW
MGRSEGVRRRTQKGSEAGRGGKARVRKEKGQAAAPEVTRADTSSYGPFGSPEAGGSEGASSRITLPPSGLASDILAREEARAIEPTVPSAPVVPESVVRSDGLAFLMAPAREEKKPVEATEHMVTFFLGEEEYGLDVRLVQEIIRPTEITPVPRAPEFVMGVINLRGRIIPVVDLKRKLSLGEVEAASRTSRIVVAKLRDRLVGLLVDGASQVLKIPVSLIEPAPEEVVEVDVDYIRGVAKLEGRLVILMDLRRVLGLDQAEPSPA